MTIARKIFGVLPLRMLFGLAIAALMTGGTLYVIARYSGGYRQFWILSSGITPGHWVLLILLTVLFYLADYARYYTLFAVCGDHLPLSLGLQLTCASFFVSTLTPGSELYIPVAIFLAARRGIPAAHTAAVAMIKPLYLTAWVCLVGMVSLAARSDVHLPLYLSRHLSVCMLPFGLLVLTFAYVIFYPDRFLAWASLSTADPAVPHWKKVTLSGLARCARAISFIGHSRSRMHLMAHAASLLFILAYTAVGTAVAHALGIPLSPGKALAVFSNSLMVCYLAPSPGGMGFTEMATAYLLNPSLSQNAMAAGTLLRFFCWYIVVIPGALILAYAANMEGLKRFFRKGISAPFS